MGLFSKKSDEEEREELRVQEAAEDKQQLFDDYFREELRNHGRWYFDKVIKENGDLFSKDLETIIDQVNVDLKEHVSRHLENAIADINASLKAHVTSQMEAQFATYSRTMQEAQDLALKNMTDGSNELKTQYGELSNLLKSNIADQNAMMHSAFEEHKVQLQAMDNAQNASLQALNQSTERLQQQYVQIGQLLDGQIQKQQDMIIGAFENNMAATVEHYILGALGDQFDMKAQMPGILKQLEANKQAMVDDIKL